MVVALQTLIDRSVKNMGTGINPRVKEYAVELIKRAYKEGIYVQISSGFRSNAEQTKLYNQGRTTKGNIVTNAKAGQSIHNYGLAIDYFLVSDDGNDALWVVNDKWKRVAAIGKSMGFQWGGDWKSFRDYPHLDMQKGMSLSQLASGKRPSIPPLSDATPVDVKPADKGYLAYGDRHADVLALAGYLNKIGYSVDEIDFYNADIKKAVMAFQKARGLEVDGIYGVSSKNEMNKALKEVDAKIKADKAKAEKEAETASKGEINLADLFKPTTGEGKNALLRVLKRFEKKDKPLGDVWRKKVEDGTMTHDEAIEVVYVAVDRGYITGLVDTQDLLKRVEALEQK